MNSNFYIDYTTGKKTNPVLRERVISFYRQIEPAMTEDETISYAMTVWNRVMGSITQQEADELRADILTEVRKRKEGLN